MQRDILFMVEKVVDNIDVGNDKVSDDNFDGTNNNISKWCQCRYLY